MRYQRTQPRLVTLSGQEPRAVKMEEPGESIPWENVKAEAGL